MVTYQRFEQGLSRDEEMASLQKNQGLFKATYEEVESAAEGGAFFQG